MRAKTQRIADLLWSNGEVRERRLFDGWIVLDLSRSPGHRLLYLEGERWVAEASLVRSLVRPGEPAIDVGASIGYYALLLKQAGASPVVCVEPEPENLLELRRTIARNSFEDVEVVAAAAGAAPGVVHLRPGPNAAIADEGIAVEQVTVDWLTRSAGLLKIDVEGYERHVLEGAKTLLERTPNLFVELA